jgi:hypothetical protein
MSRSSVVCGVVAAVLLLLPASQVLAGDEPVNPATWPWVLTRGLFSGGGDFLKGDEPDRPFDLAFRGVGMLLEAGRFQMPGDFAFAVAFDDQRYPHYVDYSMGLVPAVRVGAASVGLLMQHTSRHIHDAPRMESVGWYRAGVRVSATATHDRWRLGGTVDAMQYLAQLRRYVDYDWELAGAGRASRDISDRSAYYVDAAIRTVRCLPDVAGRTWVVGARVEGGMNLGFGFGRADVFVGWDRRIDPTPFSRSVVNFFVFGARFMIARGFDSRTGVPRLQ